MSQTVISKVIFCMTSKQDTFCWREASIVNCEWLHQNLNRDDIRLFDCSSFLDYTDNHPTKPYNVISGFSEYKKSHIPNSAFLDLQNNFSAQESAYSFTLPKLPNLAVAFQRAGVGDNCRVVLYSRNGIQWATRFWWMLHVLGYEKVSILNGGFRQWLALGLPTETKITAFQPASFCPSIKEDIFVDKNYVLAAIEENNHILINALTKDIHDGLNPRYGRPGHIPKSLNIPFHKFIHEDTEKFISFNEAKELIKNMKIEKHNIIVNYCGGGIAATLDAFILYQLGYKNLKIYDNSMSEWAMDETLPINVGF